MILINKKPTPEPEPWKEFSAIMRLHLYVWAAGFTFLAVGTLL